MKGHTSKQGTPPFFLKAKLPATQSPIEENSSIPPLHPAQASCPGKGGHALVPLIHAFITTDPSIKHWREIE